MKHLMMAAICMASGGVAAAGLSINHVPMQGGTSLQACLQRGGNALQQAGLRRLNNTPSAAWAENAAADQIYAVYCVMETGTMVIAGSGPSGEAVSGTVGAVRNILRGGGGKQ